MYPQDFEALVHVLSDIPGLNDLPERIPCIDCDMLRDIPLAAGRRKWLRKAKAEITRRDIQSRVDDIAAAREDDDELSLHVLLAAFPEDLKLYKTLTAGQRQMWIDKAALAARGRARA
jgi:hypothetical protein